MPIRELLPFYLREDFCRLSKAESLLLEANLFMRIAYLFCEELRNQYKDYQKLIKHDLNMEDEMIETDFLRFLINDIISTNDYTLEGIANIIRIPVDAILEVVSGINTNPSLVLATRIIKLHGEVRRGLYGDLIKKVMEESSGHDSP